MIPAPSNRTTNVWPLADLFDALRRNGFLLRPDDYTQVVQVLDAFQPQSYVDLRSLIAPLLVTSEEEQEKFDRIFEQVQQKEGMKPHAVKPKKLPWKRMSAAFLGLLALGYIAFLWPGPAFIPAIQLGGSTGTLAVGDTLVLSVDSSMLKAAGPIVRWQWETPYGEPYPNAHEPILRVPVRNAGSLIVFLRSQRGRGLLVTTWTDSLVGINYPVCAKLPVVKLDSVRLSSKPLRYRFSARVVGNSPTVQRTQWQLNGGVVATNRMDWEHTFPAGEVPGYYDVRFGATTDSTSQLCFGNDQLTVAVPGTDKPPFTFETHLTGSPITIITSLNKGLLWGSWVVGGLLLLLAGIYAWLSTRKPEPTPPASPAGTNPMTRFTSDTPPLEIPLENRETELITLDQSVYRLIRTLRQPAESDVRRLHIGQTMQATMQEGGFPTLIFQPHLAEINYLFLIDRSQVRSQQVALFEYLFRVFTQENVCVERFFFHKTFTLFTNETHKKGMTLRQLADSYQTHTLVIWSTGYPLLYPPYPVVEPAIREALADWESRAILTPVPVADWAGKERALQADFLLLPADMPGQLRLMQALSEKQTQQETYLQQQPDLYSVADINAEEVDELEDYLGEDLFQWLAALAIYPRIRWEIILEIGRVLMPPEAVNFTNLLKLARISWMNEGHFPDYTRLELLKKLYPENEVKARKRLLQLLAYAEQYFPGEHFYDGEKYLLQTVNQFVLYAHDAETFAEYQPAQQAFKELYQQRLYPDGATLRYLENPTGSWTTLLPTTRTSVPNKTIKSAVGRVRPVGLQDYLNNLPEPIANDPPEPPADKRKGYLLVAMGVTLLSLIGLIYLTTRPRSQDIDWNQQVPLTIVLDTSSCMTAENKNVPVASTSAQVRWGVYLNDSLYSFRDLKATRSFALRNLVLVERLADVSADSVDLWATVAVSDTNAGSNRQYNTVQLTRDTLRVRINCPAKPSVIKTKNDITRLDTTRLRVSVEYTNPNGPGFAKIQAYMKALQADTLIEFVRPLKPAIFAGRSQVRYFQTADKAAAEALAAQAGKALGMPIGVQFTQANRTNLRHLEVWINNGVAIPEYTCQPVAKTWFNQFYGWQVKGQSTNGSVISVVGDTITLREASPDGSDKVPAEQSTGTIAGICRQNGVYLVSLYSRAGRTLLVKNVTRTSCYIASVNMLSGLPPGPEGQLYLTNLVKTSVFQRYAVPEKKTGKQAYTITKEPASQPNQQQSQTAPPENAYNAQVSQTKAPAQTSTENLRITSQKQTDPTLQEGIKAYERGQYAEAIAFYDKFLAENPDDPYALNLKGYSLFKLKRYEEAVTTLLSATKVDPGYAWAYFDLARVYCALGQLSEADQARQQAIQIRPSMRSIMQNDKEFMRLCRPMPSSK